MTYRPLSVPLDRRTKTHAKSQQKTVKESTSLNPSTPALLHALQHLGSTSPASAAPTCSRCSTNLYRSTSHASFAGLREPRRVISGSRGPIATKSPASARADRSAWRVTQTVIIPALA